MKEREIEHEDVMKYANSVAISRLPHLIIEIVKVAYTRKVFNPGGASRIIQGLETREGYDK
jgi:hypothetical protein